MAPLEIGAGGFHEFVHRGRTAAAGGLVGRKDHALDAVLTVDRPQRHQRGDGGAVRVGDDALVIPDAAGVDLGDHQRDVRVHAEGRGIVDHNGACLDRNRRELAGNAAAGREQRDVDALEGALGEFLDHDLFAAERDGLAGGAGAGQRLELADRKTAAVHGGDEFGADSAGDADYRDDGIVTHFRFSMFSAGNKKAPDLFRRGFG